MKERNKKAKLTHPGRLPRLQGRPRPLATECNLNLDWVDKSTIILLPLILSEIITLVNVT